ncbi:MAG: response regulator [Raineya sp.]|jgi:response regulator RpfG family c-di-GMP phosphodiesterase|nr:response regulator [Raineya sp.]
MTEKYKILYVDDEESNLRIFKMTFKRDYEVFTAISGLEAIEVLKLNPIQLIITDQKMPEMTGTEFLEKTLPDHPDVIRIILTGFSDIEAIVRAVNKANIYKYVTKPWNREDFKIIIDEALTLFQYRANKDVRISFLEKENEDLRTQIAVLKEELNKYR